MENKEDFSMKVWDYGYKKYYTYDLNNPPATAPQPEDITIIFPNASALGSGGGLQVGDKVKLGTFAANSQKLFTI